MIHNGPIIPIKKWEISPKIPGKADKILGRYPPILRQILYNRGIKTVTEARHFLEAVPPETAYNQFDMRDMGTACGRLYRAMRDKEPIIIYGDYDVDGITSTALLVSVLKELGGDARPYIPNRFDEGYGLNKNAIDYFKFIKIPLIVSVDCGIRAVELVQHAKDIGIDMIICDHHYPGDTMPPALAVVNPKQPRDTYPFKEFAAVGLAYKLACGIVEYMGSDPATEGVNPDDYLDLVALGTVADVTPLVSENRTLVRRGLDLLHQSKRLGIRILAEAAGVSLSNLSATDIGFMLGPRLNAAGRLSNAWGAYKLLVADQISQAKELAMELNKQNSARQRITRSMHAKADEIVATRGPDQWVLFAADPSFNPGVVGLAASRLADAYYRPSIVGFQGETHVRASCRSIPEFNITEALDECADLLDSYGGHHMAAGLTVSNDNVNALITRLQEIGADKLSDLDVHPVLQADMEIELARLDATLLNYLDWVEPTGAGNPAVHFVTRGVQVVSSKAIGKAEKHLKMTLKDGDTYLEAIAFRQGHWYGHLSGRVDILYTCGLNEYRGITRFQLYVQDIRPASVGSI
jgi:single-stranded-DNA-specific exonuclease